MQTDFRIRRAKRPVWCVALVSVIALAIAGPVNAAPQPRVGMFEARWSEHTVIPGERLEEIARLYNVTLRDLWVWNRLPRGADRVDVGTRLRVFSPIPPPARTHVVHHVVSGDSWASISKKYGIAERYLHRWNRKLPRKLESGSSLDLWVGTSSVPQRPAPQRPAPRQPKKIVYTPSEHIGPAIRVEPRRASLPIPGRRVVVAEPVVDNGALLPRIRQGGESVGTANRGHLVRGVGLPASPQHYTIRKPDERYGSSHAIGLLQGSIARFRRAHSYSGEIVIGSISKRKGGRLRGHKSHQSGRDVDIRLPLARGRKRGSVPESVKDVDWDATWGLIHELLRTNEVEYIFLDTRRQKALYRAAKRAGARADMLEKWLQYPQRAGTRDGIVRHAKGHTSHFHVRFFCGPREAKCEGPRRDPRRS